MKLSVLLSGIRALNWEKLYHSIGKSYTQADYELIIVSPYELPDILSKIPNIKWFHDYGSPTRCQQRALTYAKGEYINWAADDGFFTDGSMDIAFNSLGGEKWRCDYKTIIVGKYREGDGDTSAMVKDNYYLLNNHLGSQCKYLPLETPLLNVGLISRKLLLEVGGWDSSKFEVLPYAYNDLAVRLKNYECKFILQPEVMFECGHMPGMTGDHGPIHTAQTFHDEPMFKLLYNRIETKDRINIDLNNWEYSPVRWERRFGKES